MFSLNQLTRFKERSSTQTGDGGFRGPGSTATLCSTGMFPTIISLREAELGPLVLEWKWVRNPDYGIVGGAVLAVIQGVIADQLGLHHGFVLSPICYLEVPEFAGRGSVDLHS